jgi:hypothetical protein
MTTTVLEDITHATDPHTHAVIRGYKLSGDSGANWRRFGLEFAVVSSLYPGDSFEHDVSGLLTFLSSFVVVIPADDGFDFALVWSAGGPVRHQSTH